MVIPERVPPRGFVSMVNVTEAVDDSTKLSLASLTSATTAGEIGWPETASVGWVTKIIFVATTRWVVSDGPAGSPPQGTECEQPKTHTDLLY